MGIAYNKIVERNNLILYWDTANPKCYTQNTQQLKDISNNNNTGIMYNSIVLDTDKSMMLNGINNYIQGTCNCNSKNYSISWWIKPYSLITYSNTIKFDNGWGSFACSTTKDGEIIAGTDAATGFTVFDLPAKTATVNVWSNYVFTFDNGTAKFYKNSVCLSTKSNMTISSNSFKNFYVGTNSSDTVSGNINSIMIYNSTLTDTQVLTNYEALSHRYT